MSYIRRTTIGQHRGEHSPGLHHFELTDIITDLGDRAGCPYEGLTPEDKGWWERVLDNVHAAGMKLAPLDAEERHALSDALLKGGECNDLEGLATHLRDTMAHALAVRHH